MTTADEIADQMVAEWYKSRKPRRIVKTPADQRELLRELVLLVDAVTRGLEVA